MSEHKVLQLPQMQSVWQETMGWQPNLEQQQQFQQLYELIVEGNQQINLTRITAPMEFWEKHIWDSLRGIKGLWEQENTVLQAIDIGTGAGFPGLPVAISRPQWQVTLLDATRKKIAFIESLLSPLAIENAATFTGRAEKIRHLPQHRQTYDRALIRAVASVSICAKYALPLLKPNGLAILYRGHCTEEEIEQLNATTDPFGGVVESVEAFATPVTQATRHCVYLRKVR